MAARSVTGAARRLGLQQPAMSAALGRLRVQFGDELFVRIGRGMQPTPRALSLSVGIASALDQLRSTLGAEIPFDPPTAERTFVLGLTDYAVATLGPVLIGRVRSCGRGLNLRFVSYAKDDVETMITGGVLDLAVGVFAEPPEGCVVTPILAERFIGIARRGHPALSGERPAVGDAARFAALDHALYTIRGDTVGAIDRALAIRGLTRRVALTVPYVSLLPGIVARSELVAAIPERIARHVVGGLSNGQDGDIEMFDLPVEIAPWTLHMVWSPFARSDRANAWLRDHVVAAAGECD